MERVECELLWSFRIQWPSSLVDVSENVIFYCQRHVDFNDNQETVVLQKQIYLLLTCFLS
jgi:hypothetical protein